MTVEQERLRHAHQPGVVAPDHHKRLAIILVVELGPEHLRKLSQSRGEGGCDQGQMRRIDRYAPGVMFLFLRFIDQRPDLRMHEADAERQFSAILRRLDAARVKDV